MKLFRNGRKLMISSHNTTKYIKYAVGEIFLVVIGILIALQLNNWNENRKKEMELLSIYENIASDLEIDLVNIDSLKTNSLRDKTVFEKVINDEMTEEDYHNCSTCLFILSGFPDISMLDNGYKLLSNFTDFKIKEDRDFVKSINQFYSFYQTEIGVDQQSLNLIFNRRDQYWTENHAWYADYLMKKRSQDIIDFALQNPEYKNQVTRFYTVYYSIYIKHLQAYMKDAKEIIRQIRLKTHTTRK